MCTIGENTLADHTYTFHRTSSPVIPGSANQQIACSWSLCPRQRPVSRLDPHRALHGQTRYSLVLLWSHTVHHHVMLACVHDDDLRRPQMLCNIHLHVFYMLITDYVLMYQSHGTSSHHPPPRQPSLPFLPGSRMDSNHASSIRPGGAVEELVSPRHQCFCLEPLHNATIVTLGGCKGLDSSSPASCGCMLLYRRNEAAS
ncbi:uncharacterized protein F5Z01DRAFT_646972 [Emericellopsis atlantica]|uniref:Uncharacterized protein n=1 Tax=Emericellopsis atlantica TaxID=2614577 RepID=A0A9P8CUQ3_9HYPO|nr:uncharacterized protein F5Z01DRAFT_646972 [Emericellopsis atlantica]KAG9257761.1 hypothetical protein F5Z01DRAFT_646972 [Emericellopsis atlantica]